MERMVHVVGGMRSVTNGVKRGSVSGRQVNSHRLTDRGKNYGVETTEKYEKKETFRMWQQR